jgi:hypothetical protein
MKTFCGVICILVLWCATLADAQEKRAEAPAEKQPDKGVKASGEQKKLDLDLEKFQGQWESKDYGASSPESGIARVTRRVEGKKNTVTFFNKDGEVMHEHWSDIELQQSGAVLLYRYKMREVTAGPQKGQTWPVGPISSYSSYVYKFDGDKHYEIVGAIANDPRPPSIIVWTRIKDK